MKLVTQELIMLYSYIIAVCTADGHVVQLCRVTSVLSQSQVVIGLNEPVILE